MSCVIFTISGFKFSFFWENLCNRWVHKRQSLSWNVPPWVTTRQSKPNQSPGPKRATRPSMKEFGRWIETGKAPISSVRGKKKNNVSHRRRCITVEKDTPESFVNRKTRLGKMPRSDKKQTKQLGNLVFFTPCILQNESLLIDLKDTVFKPVLHCRRATYARVKLWVTR